MKRQQRIHRRVRAVTSPTEHSEAASKNPHPCTLTIHCSFMQQWGVADSIPVMIRYDREANYAVLCPASINDRCRAPSCALLLGACRAASEFHPSLTKRPMLRESTDRHLTYKSSRLVYRHSSHPDVVMKASAPPAAKRATPRARKADTRDGILPPRATNRRGSKAELEQENKQNPRDQHSENSDSSSRRPSYELREPCEES